MCRKFRNFVIKDNKSNKDESMVTLKNFKEKW